MTAVFFQYLYILIDIQIKYWENKNTSTAVKTEYYTVLETILNADGLNNQ